MSTRLVLAFFAFVAHQSTAFVPRMSSKPGLPLSSRTSSGPRSARVRTSMTSTAPSQPEMPGMDWGDFESWFWGNAHVKGGVEHAVFKDSDSAVVLFDGDCNFCNSGIWIILANSDERNMRFCAQNTEIGNSLLSSFGQDQERLSSIALLDKDGHLHTHSDAIIQILGRMQIPYPALGYALSLIPRPLRDTLYSVVSNNRHNINIENLTCRIPEENELNRFVM